MARVLVIDEGETVVRAMRALFARDGHVVEQLPLLGQLPATIKRFAPDVVVLDLDSGDALPSFVRASLRDECRSTIPVIVYSSQSDREVDEAVATIGNAFAVAKAAPMMFLRAAIRRSIDESRMIA